MLSIAHEAECVENKLRVVLCNKIAIAATRIHFNHIFAACDALTATQEHIHFTDTQLPVSRPRRSGRAHSSTAHADGAPNISIVIGSTFARRDGREHRQRRFFFNIELHRHFPSAHKAKRYRIVLGLVSWGPGHVGDTQRLKLELEDSQVYLPHSRLAPKVWAAPQGTPGRVWLKCQVCDPLASLPLTFLMG